ncbi:hypothetical protein, partial [Synechococcus sp. R55.2]|uniref:hypothetical protein n=1 Tax=Synechococcus sp. R55.2 TaxID=2964496 RepID=UPI0039C3068A
FQASWPKGEYDMKIYIEAEMSDLEIKLHILLTQGLQPSVKAPMGHRTARIEFKLLIPQIIAFPHRAGAL